ncbi:glycosyltransferase family 4 protein [Allofournierella sp.]|uniref:glycosyltransferase family 4 protein n=1 Tax=Allofournierella sp. TaxID=1940256 RepID=UPI003AB89E7C
MKLFWMLNFLPPELSQALGLPAQASGSWVQALRAQLAALPGAPQLTLCGYTPHVTKAQRRIIGGTAYLALPAAGGRAVLARALAEDQPDLVLLFGTESEHALWVLQSFDPARILVYIQGLAGPCGAHMADGLPPRFLRRQPLKEALAARTGGATVRQLAARLTARGEREKQVLALARHVLGRTGWDKAYCEQHAPAARYYPLGEILRQPFYAGGWRRQGCIPHRIFVSQGNLPLKGLHRAIEALPALLPDFPDAALFVAGWPPPDKGPLLRPAMRWLAEYPGYLAALAEKLGVADRIHYTGVLGADAMREEFLKSETYLLCSSIENSPNSLGEAMLLGMPCAASAVGGVPSLLESGAEGVLFNPSAPGALAAALAGLWADPARADALAAAARTRALADHDGPAIAAQLLAICRQALAGL